MRVLIVNHSYQVKNFDAEFMEGFDCFFQIGSDESLYEKLISFNKNVIKVDLFEALSTVNKVSRGWMIEYKFCKKIKDFNDVVFCGCQDYFSWRIFRCCLKHKIKFSVIPDNIEFFLRPSSSVKSVIPIAVSLSLMFLYRLRPREQGSYFSFFGRRVIYGGINSSNLMLEYSFYNLAKSQSNNFNCEANKSICFVSQPYIQDYNLDYKSWLAHLKNMLDLFKNKMEGDLFVRFHQRDSREYRIALSGLSDNKNLHDPSVYLGLFSTFLFEEALKGKRVYSFFFYFKNFLPYYYSEFIDSLVLLLDLDVKGDAPWVLTDNSFEILVSNVFE